MTILPPTEIVAACTSPTASFAVIAYGTLTRGWRGVISGSAPTWMPKWRTGPVNSVAGSGVVSPSWVEK
jgi:hypothetical protein